MDKEKVGQFRRKLNTNESKGREIKRWTETGRRECVCLRGEKCFKVVFLLFFLASFSKIMVDMKTKKSFFHLFFRLTHFKKIVNLALFNECPNAFWPGANTAKLINNVHMDA